SGNLTRKDSRLRTSAARSLPASFKARCNSSSAEGCLPRTFSFGAPEFACEACSEVTCVGAPRNAAAPMTSEQRYSAAGARYLTDRCMQRILNAQQGIVAKSGAVISTNQSRRALPWPAHANFARRCANLDASAAIAHVRAEGMLPLFLN